MDGVKINNSPLYLQQSTLKLLSPLLELTRLSSGEQKEVKSKSAGRVCLTYN